MSYFSNKVLLPRTKNFLLKALKWLGGLLLSTFILTSFINRLIDYFTGPGAYIVYLVGDFSDKNRQQLRVDFEKQRKPDLKIAGTAIHFRTLDAKEKDAEKFSGRLAENPDTLLLIGHLSTTASANALPNYLNANPPIPVILALETNPELLPPDCRINYCPVFRLSPTDNQQAAQAADFVISQGAQAIWVVDDVVENSMYSQYLSGEFIRQVHEKSRVSDSLQILAENRIQERRQAYDKSHLQEKRQAHEEREINATTSEPIDEKKSRVLLWTTNLEFPSDVVKTFGIDWVFFAGSPRDCLILTRQLKQIWKDDPQHRPKILLGNACADWELLPQGGEDVKEAFLTHPMAASDFNKDGFGPRGTQAFQLLQELIEGADYDFGELSRKNVAIGYYVRWILGLHSVADARNVLRWYMERAVITGQSFSLGNNSYTFNGDGTVREIAFHMWQVLSNDSNKVEFGDYPKTVGNKTEFTEVPRPPATK